MNEMWINVVFTKHEPYLFASHLYHISAMINIFPDSEFSEEDEKLKG